MTWERPWAWWVLTALVPVVLLHLHLRRRRPVVVASVMLWRRLGVARVGARGFRRVRDTLAMVLVALGVTGFVAALAGPVTGAAAGAPRHLVVVLDGSASMNATTDDGGSRFEHARRAAQAAVRRRGPSDPVTVWLATDRPHVALSPSISESEIRDVLAAAQPTLEPGGLAATLALARLARQDSQEAVDVLVLTDEVGAASLTAREDRIRFGDGWTVAVAPSGAVADAELAQAEPDADDGTLLRVTALSRIGGDVPRTLVTRVGGVEVDRQEVAFRDGRSSHEVRVPAPQADAVVEFVLEPPDSLAENDAARLWMSAGRRLAVAVTARSGTPSAFLVDALAAAEGLVDPARTVLVAPGAPPSVLAGADVVVADGAAGASLPVHVPRLEFRGEGGREVEAPALWATGDHPVLAGVDLGPLRIGRAVVLVPDAADTVLVATAAGPVAVAGERGGVRHVVLGFRPDATTLPLEAAFPVLVRNALDWLSHPPPLPPWVPSGQPLIPAEPLPRGVERVWVDGPGDHRGVARVTPAGLPEALVEPPPPGGPYVLSLLGLARTARTVVRWTPPADFTLLAPPGARPPRGAVLAADAARALPDRTGDVDTRRRFGAVPALIGALLLCVGGALLRLGGRQGSVTTGSAPRARGEGPPPVPRPGARAGGVPV